MAEDTQKPTTEPEAAPPAQPTDQTDHTPDGALNTEHMIPKTRFDEVNNKAKAEAERAAKLEQELTEYRTAQAKAEEDRLKKQGEFEQLYTQEQAKAADLQAQLAAKVERLERLEAVFAARLEKRLETLPDYIKPLIAKMDAFEANQYLDEHEADFAQADTGQPRKQPPPPMNGADGVARGGKQPLFNVGRVKL